MWDHFGWGEEALTKLKYIRNSDEELTIAEFGEE